MKTMEEELVCLTLNNGVKLPTLGYSVPPGMPSANCLEVAVNSGFRHVILDVRDDLDLEIGHLLRRWIETETLAREDLFISVKISIDDPTRANLKSRFVQRLYTVGCDYFDLLLLEIPKARPQNDGKQLIRPAKNLTDGIKDNVVRIWKTVTSLVEEGYIRSTGVLCRDHQNLLDILKRSDVKPQVIYASHESSLVSNYLPQLTRYCRNRQLQAVVEVEPVSNSNGHTSLSHKKVQEISKKLGRIDEQVLVRSLMERGMGVSCQCSVQDTIEQCFKIYDFKLERQDLIDLTKTSYKMTNGV